MGTTDSAVTITAEVFERLIREIGGMSKALEETTKQMVEVRNDVRSVDQRLERHLGPDGPFQRATTDIATLRTRVDHNGVTPTGARPINYAEEVARFADSRPRAAAYLLVGIVIGIVGVGVLFVVLYKAGIL